MNSKNTLLIGITFLATILTFSAIYSLESEQHIQEKKWAAEIEAFKRWDAKNSFPDNALLFVGSSSIRRWETARAFPKMNVINRGFGGSDIPAVNFFFDNIVACYRPAKICFYAGDNDIAAGHSPETVYHDFVRFCELCDEKLPDTEIIFISIKPSGSRFHLWPRMRQANTLIESFCRTRPRLSYVDLATCLLDKNGTPNDDLFLPDRLHLNQQGYRLWTANLKSLLR